MLMCADDSVLSFSNHQSKEIEETLIRVGDFKPGKTKVALYGTAKKQDSQESCNVSILCSPISSESKYEYIGTTLDSHLTLAEQSAKF